LPGSLSSFHPAKALPREARVFKACSLKDKSGHYSGMHKTQITYLKISNQLKIIHAVVQHLSKSTHEDRNGYEDACSRRSELNKAHLDAERELFEWAATQDSVFMYALERLKRPRISHLNKRIDLIEHINDLGLRTTLLKAALKIQCEAETQPG
jgi:hypothetical protein